MLKKKEAFLKILSVELEDLNEDIKILIEECENKRCNEQITNYVFLENLAVLRNELFGVKSFLKDVKLTSPHEYETLDSLIDRLIEILKNRCHEKGIALSIVEMVKRKMNKVKIYVEK